MEIELDQERKCLQCGEPITGNSKKQFCDDGCRMKFHNNKIKNLIGTNVEINNSNLGQFAKIKIIEDLIKKGYSIFEPVFSTHNYLVAEKDLALLKVSIRTGYRTGSNLLRYRNQNDPHIFEKVNIVAIYDPVNEDVIYKSESAEWKPE